MPEITKLLLGTYVSMTRGFFGIAFISRSSCIGIIDSGGGSGLISFKSGSSKDGFCKLNYFFLAESLAEVFFDFKNLEI